MNDACYVNEVNICIWQLFFGKTHLQQRSGITITTLQFQTKEGMGLNKPFLRGYHGDVVGCITNERHDGMSSIFGKPKEVLKMV